jgi:Xaa-Pro aminopeptidase
VQPIAQNLNDWVSPAPSTGGRQNFDDICDPSSGVRHLALLREIMTNHLLDGFLVPHEDEFLNEYLPRENERLAWATGFTGSAGAAAILRHRAAVFVDGRYAVQVVDQVDQDAFETVIVESRDDLLEGLCAYLIDWVEAGSRIGCDPRLHSLEVVERLRQSLDDVGAQLVELSVNPIDEAWGRGRPSPSKVPFISYPAAYAGEATSDKIRRVREAMSVARVDAVLITSPASIAWLFNIRGNDVPRTPLTLAHAVVHASGKAELFADESKVVAVRAALGSDIWLLPPEAVVQALAALQGRRVLVDGSASSAFWVRALEDAQVEIVLGSDPCDLPRACKTPAEQEGARNAHLRDGTALTRFLHWLDHQEVGMLLDEISCVRQLEAFREGTGLLRDLAFDTIAGAGPNAAIIHYRPTVRQNRPLEAGSVLLVDSGAQYLDGTTDVTRTIAIGEPSEEIKTRFTLVLKGFLALTYIRFPAGTTGIQLDALARAALWCSGFDYDHGTGHGVGAYLAVHEGPQRISKSANMVPLRPGMIISNEPGYYKPGAYGLRIENLQIVTEAEELPGGDRAMHGFEPLTLAPIDKRLIIAGRLTCEERVQLNVYHQLVSERLGPLVDEEVRLWLDNACAPIAGF